jgi:hypothetical protein
MRYIKHNVIENFNQSTPQERATLLVEEMSKAYTLYPEAVANILDSTQIKYRSKHPQDLADAVRENSGNLKMLNRIIRLSFLVNQDGKVIRPNHKKTISYRDVMRQGTPFLKKYPNELKEATLIARDMMKENLYSKTLDSTMVNYLNMDGQEPIVKKSSNCKMTTIIILALVGLGIFAYYKNKKS